MLPTIGTPRESHEAWNLGRRKQLVAPSYTVGRTASLNPAVTPQLVRSGDPFRLDDSDAMRMSYEAKTNALLEEMRMVYESKATKFLEDFTRYLEDLKRQLADSTKAISEEQRSSVKQYSSPQILSQVSTLQDKTVALARQVDDLELNMQSVSSRAIVTQADLQRIVSSQVGESTTSVLSEEQIHRIVCDVVQSEVDSAETRLQNTIGPHLDKLRASNSNLGKRLDEVSSSCRTRQPAICELERRLAQVELAQQRVGTPGAAEWLNMARKELDNLGQSLKNCPKVQGQPMADQLLGDMKKAQLLVQQSSVFASSCNSLISPSSALCDKVVEDPFPVGNGSLGEQGDPDDDDEDRSLQERGLVLDRGLDLGGLQEEEAEDEDNFNWKSSEAMAKWLLLECNKLGELEALEEEPLFNVEGLG